MKKKLLALSASSLLLLGACSTASNVATTNVGNITKDELYETMKQSQGTSALFTLLAQKVAQANVKDKDAVNKKVDEYLSSTITSAGGEEKFLALLNQRGYTSKEQFRQLIYSSYAINQFIKEQTTVTDEEIAAAYETYEMNVSAKHILVADEATANEIITKLNNGEDWDTLAKENSTDTSNKDNGGDLGSFKPSNMDPSFAQALKDMKDGEISKTPVKTNYGYHIIKMVSNPAKGTLEELKETIRQELIDAKVADSSYQQQVIQKALQNANVNITDEFLKSAFTDILTPVESTTTTQQSTSSETTTETTSNK